MAHVITLYNHKGGVSKTTTTFNLAYLLVERGSSVLVVDADPQCNMTELMLSKQIAELDSIEADTGETQGLPGTSLLQALQPRLNGDIPQVNVEEVDTIEVAERLHLLRGDVGLSDTEDALAEAHNQRFSNKTHEKRTYVAMSDFLRRLADKQGADYVLIDVGPSSGALTRTCFLSCDAFFVPSVPDRFNVQAIGTLSAILRKWLSEHNQIVADFRELGLPVAEGKPAFLGLITQNFKTISGEPKKSYRLWIDRMPKRFNDRLRPVLEEFSGQRDLTSGLTQQDCIVARIPDFVSLAPLMQELGKPVFGITQIDTRILGQQWQGNVWEDKLEKMSSYKAQLAHLAEIVEAL